MINLREALQEAATKFDGRPGELPGHVTNGSMEAQVKVIREYLDEFVQEVKSRLKTAGDFGRFDEPGQYGEYVAIEILKKVREKYA